MLDYIPIIQYVPLWVKIPLALITSVFLILKSLRFVREGELGVKLRWEKAIRDKNNEPVIVEPGFILLIPFVENLATRHVRDQILELTDQEIILSNDSTFLISTAVSFRVSDVYKALFEIDVLNVGIRTQAMAVLKEVYGSISEISEAKEYKENGKKMAQNLRSRVENWGVKIEAFDITNFAPTEQTADFMAVTAAVKYRTNALEESKVDMHRNPALAAALIGVPVVASIPDSESRWDRNDGHVDSRPDPKKK